MTHKAADLYNIPRWSEGYFDVNSEGEVCILPHPLPVESDTLSYAQSQTQTHTQSIEDGVSLNTIREQLRANNISLPCLVRFPGILHDRVSRLASAFQTAMAEQDYQGNYIPVYPIKVNQQKRVVDELVKGQVQSVGTIGLEAGSKPELMAVLSIAGDYPDTPVTVVCNGYKDRHYIRLALMGEALGHRVFIVIEKLSELPLVLEESKNLGVTPRLGLRARLASIGKGNWQNTGGEKSKFGLSATQILELISLLKQEDMVECLELLHFHLGSQIANIQDIQTGLTECGRFYQNLIDCGVHISTLDVGGGLGVDYEGTHSRSYCSMNYSQHEYARTVVQAFASAAKHAGKSMPDIISESGRAMTAHHAVLISNVIDIESNQSDLDPSLSPKENWPVSLQQLWQVKNSIETGRTSPLELYHQVINGFDQLNQQFTHSNLPLEQRAAGEQLAQYCYEKIKQQLNPGNRHHREALDDLNEKLADKLFVNFSLFQSLPDVWGIDQVFPILPLKNLNQPSLRRAVIQDITCDSDGRIDQYVDGEGLETTLPIPEFKKDEEYLLGFFMIGAYQEILGDLHNLFGDSPSVDAYIEGQSVKLKHHLPGDSISNVLDTVHFNKDDMISSYKSQIKRANLTTSLQTSLMEELLESLSVHTYLEL